ncbi:MAG TPA: pyridoxal-dependent decarboxylase [Chitinophagaceae bacterium]|nr:pyridoxal-dependent decarboxylase [Chitinophagaceae bacterium]
MEKKQPTATEVSLDPQHWDELRATGHRMLDDMFNYLQQIRHQPVWQSVPEASRKALSASLPQHGADASEIYDEFLQHILPYNLGNVHPRFWGWVCGTGTPTAMLADMLASGMNASPSFGDHADIYVEKQVINWSKEMLGFPQESSGLLTTGGSMANLLALSVARNHFNNTIRATGLRNAPGQLVIYGSVETHNCVQKAVELLGIGSEHYRKIPVNASYRIRPDLLQEKIEEDIRNGYLPFCIVGNAGTVNTGAIDDLELLAGIAKQYNCWLHVDGAFGAVLNILPEYKDKLKGLALADSLAFDYHKWFYVNYDAGCVLIKDASTHSSAFAVNASYLQKHERGLIAGNEHFNHLGVELSRGFRALKVWMSLKEHGIEKYRQLVRQNLQQAQYLAALVRGHEQLELLAPVDMNIVCFRFVATGFDNDQLNELNKEILMRLHESGTALPSFTVLNGCYAIRAAITNHRSRLEDFDILVKEVERLGNTIVKEVYEPSLAES